MFHSRVRSLYFLLFPNFIMRDLASVFHRSYLSLFDSRTACLCIVCFPSTSWCKSWQGSSFFHLTVTHDQCLSFIISFALWLDTGYLSIFCFPSISSCKIWQLSSLFNLSRCLRTSIFYSSLPSLFFTLEQPVFVLSASLQLNVAKIDKCLPSFIFQWQKKQLYSWVLSFSFQLSVFILSFLSSLWWW